MMHRTAAGMLIIGFFVACVYLVSGTGRYLTVDGKAEKADALVLLAGDYEHRVPKAAELYLHGFAPKIILTNDGVFSEWSEKYQRNLYDIEWAEELLVDGGVPGEAIVKLPYCNSGTIYDALAVRTWARPAGIHSLIIVTSDYHTRRSLWVFKHLFRDENVRVSVFPIEAFWRKTNRLREAREYTEEYIKIAYYYLRYGLLNNFGQELCGYKI